MTDLQTSPGMKNGGAETSALAQAEHVRRQISPTLDPLRRSELGQYMTPAVVATFMADMFTINMPTVRLLDAGAGIGALTAAFVRKVCTRPGKVKSIEVTAYEIDSLLVRQLELTLAACAQECERAGITFKSRVIRDDYILHATEPLLDQHAAEDQYDFGILNPPYAKINSHSNTRKALRRLGIETSNLYTAFVAVALSQLRSGGQLVAITPRSFCNGTYFEPFRKLLLDQSAIHNIHVYESRTKAFQDDAVLQENIIYKLVKSRAQPKTIRISSSTEPLSNEVVVHKVSFREVVHPNDQHHFIRLLTSETDGQLAHRVRALGCTLSDLGLTVSTGRVVDFRAKAHLRKLPGARCVPLIYPTHFNGGFVVWPKADSKKHNALASNDETDDLMVPQGAYVLTKRFTSKEERRRVVAVVYDPNRVKATHVGFENHLNYFHEKGRGLPGKLARGLAVFLNSTAVDQYFRQFSGHTQVNANDLRNLHYPTREQLETAADIFVDRLPSQVDIDRVIEKFL